MNVEKEYESLIYHPIQVNHTEFGYSYSSIKNLLPDIDSHRYLKNTKLDVNHIASMAMNPMRDTGSSLQLLPLNKSVNLSFSAELIPVTMTSRKQNYDQSVEGLLVDVDKFSIQTDGDGFGIGSDGLISSIYLSHNTYRARVLNSVLFRNKINNFSGKLVFIPERSAGELKHVSPNVFNNPSEPGGLDLDSFYTEVFLRTVDEDRLLTSGALAKKQDHALNLYTEFSKWTEDPSYPLFANIRVPTKDMLDRIYYFSHNLVPKDIDYSDVKRIVLSRTGLFGEGDTIESDFLIFKKICSHRYGILENSAIRGNPENIKNCYREIGYEVPPYSLSDPNSSLGSEVVRLRHYSALDVSSETLPKITLGRSLETMGCVLKDEVYDSLVNNTITDASMSAIEDLIAAYQIRYHLSRRGCLEDIDPHAIMRMGKNMRDCPRISEFDPSPEPAPRQWLRLLIGGNDRYQSMVDVLGDIPNTLFTNLHVDREASRIHLRGTQKDNDVMLLQNPLFFGIYTESIHLESQPTRIQNELDIYNSLGWSTIDRELTSRMGQKEVSMHTKPSCGFLHDLCGSTISSYAINGLNGKLYTYFLSSKSRAISFPSDFPNYSLSYLEEYTKMGVWVYKNHKLFKDSKKVLPMVNSSLVLLADRDKGKTLPYLIPYSSSFGFLMV